MKSIDILLDDDGDLLIDENGDPVVGDAEQQQIELLLKSNPGDWKLNPTVGVGLINYMNSTDVGKLPILIKKQLEMDGFKVKDIKLTGSVITVDAQR